jgi:hypothetical protein
MKKDDVRAEILDGGGDALPPPLLVGDRGLTRFHLDEEIDVTTLEIIACSGPEEANPRGGAEDLQHRGPDRLGLVRQYPHGLEFTPTRGLDSGQQRAAWRRPAPSRDRSTRASKSVTWCPRAVVYAACAGPVNYAGHVDLPDMWR